MERESPAERTDPLLPVITADVVTPGTPPALDDRRLAGLLAELDAEDLLPGDASAAATPDPARPAEPAVRPAENLPAPRSAEPTPPRAGPVTPRAQSAPSRALPLVIDSAVVDPAPAHGGPAPAQDAPAPARDRYVRRDYRPPELPADAMSLTGLSRGSRVGTVLFTAFFVGIFLLILVEVVVSLLRVGT